MKVTRSYFLSSAGLLVLILWIFLGGPLLLRGGSESQTIFWTISGLLVIPIVLFIFRKRIVRWIKNQKG